VWLDLHDRVLAGGYEPVYRDGPIAVYHR